ncbi:MAG: ABC transporter substrate-binding protein [Eubacteriales bacterium]|nr:ABC transporter substrate-binding protein [Eubacteriales bacterium]
MKRRGNWRQWLGRAIVCLMAAGGVGLAGCNGQWEEEKPAAGGSEVLEIEDVKAMGRYQEEEVSLPKGCRAIEAVEFLDTGVMRIVYSDEEQRLIAADSEDKGKTWTEKFNLTEPSGKNTGYTTCPAALAKDGGIFISTAKFMGEGNNKEAITHCLYFSPQGQKKELTVGEELNGIISRNDFSKEGRLFVKAGDSVQEIDIKEDAVISEYEKGNPVNNFGLAGNIMITIFDKDIHYYDLDTGKPLDNLEPLTKQVSMKNSNMFLRSLQVNPILFIDGDEDNSLFYIDHQGMYRYVLGGSVVEQIIDAQLNSMGAPNVGFVDFAQDEEGDFYVAVSDGSSQSGTARLLRYVYTKDMPSLPDTELTVYSLREDNALKQIAAVFQKKYPDIHLKIESGITEDEAVTNEDAVKTLNTEIMAGKGPDILILDDLPADSYIPKGLLSDMSGLLGDADILENIKNAYVEEDGSIYMLPMRFGIPVLEGRKEDLDSIRDLKSFADKVEEKEFNEKFIPTSQAYYPEKLVRGLSVTSSPAWFQDDGMLDREKISEYLEQVNRIYQAGRKAVEKYKEACGVSPDYKYSRSLGSVYTNSVTMLYDDIMLEIGGLYSPIELAAMDSMEKKHGSLTGRLWNGQAEDCFISAGIVGISEMSENNKNAEKFIRFVFSKEGQELNLGTGLPVNQGVFEDINYWRSGEEGQIVDVTSHYFEGRGSVELEVKLPGDEAIKKMQEIGKSLTVPSGYNESLLNAVADSGVEYLEGRITLGEAADRIVQEINLQLSE